MLSFQADPVKVGASTVMYWRARSWLSTSELSEDKGDRRYCNFKARASGQCY